MPQSWVSRRVGDDRDLNKILWTQRPAYSHQVRCGQPFWLSPMQALEGGSSFLSKLQIKIWWVMASICYPQQLHYPGLGKWEIACGVCRGAKVIKINDPNEVCCSTVEAGGYNANPMELQNSIKISGCRGQWGPQCHFLAILLITGTALSLCYSTYFTDIRRLCRQIIEHCFHCHVLQSDQYLRLLM